MMSRRLLIYCSMVALAIGVGVGYHAVLSPQPGVTRTNFERIKERMTEAEVERIFGEVGLDWGKMRSHICRAWHNEENTFVVLFSDGGVIHKGWYPRGTIEPVPKK